MFNPIDNSSLNIGWLLFCVKD